MEMKIVINIMSFQQEAEQNNPKAIALFQMNLFAFFPDWILLSTEK